MAKFLIFVTLGSFMAIQALAESWTGVISDSRCGAKHEAASAADVQCMKTCIKRGATPALVSGGKLFNVASSSNDQVASHLGEKVTITGKLERDYSGQFIVVESITKAE